MSWVDFFPDVEVIWKVDVKSNKNDEMLIFDVPWSAKKTPNIR